MPTLRHAVRLLVVVAICFTSVAPAGAAPTPYRTAFTRWRAVDGGFRGWSMAGTRLAPDGSLSLNLATARAGRDRRGGYAGRNFYNGGAFLVGEAVSPVVPTAFDFREAIAAWNADTPAGTWIETRVRARVGNRWTTWYNLGVWASDTATVERHSVSRQADVDGRVNVDTLALSGKRGAARAFQLQLRLFSAGGGGQQPVPSVRNASVAISTARAAPGALAPGSPARWNKLLSVPECSQMVYRDGGEIWCSPTSISMVLAYWQQAPGPCEPRVRAAVAGIYDWRYDGWGNWPFNVAYAATQNLEGYVARFTSLAQAEAWIEAGVPVVISFGWKAGTLAGAPATASSGHISVLVGFDAAGNPIVNDTAAATNETVQRTYRRAELEMLWLQHSGGTVYLVYPPGHAVPSLEGS